MEKLREFRQTLKESGLRGAFRRYGWKLFAALFAYYLVRDLILYVAIPYLVAQKLMTSS